MVADNLGYDGHSALRGSGLAAIQHSARLLTMGLATKSGNSTQRPISVFCSYARRDEHYRDELEKALAPLRVANMITDWHDRKILAGDDWNQAIEDKLRAAHVILFLVSSDLFNSPYVKSNELPMALARHKAGDAVVIPIIVRTCLWRVTQLSQLNATPPDGKPIAKWDDIDDAFTEVAQAVYLVIKDLVSRQVPETMQELRSELGQIWNVPHPRNRYFIGREAVIAASEDALESHRPVVLIGEGGVGKSEIATEYAHRHRAQYSLVWWMRAESRQSLIADSAALARELNLPEAEERDFDKVVAAVHRRLARSPGWLLLFDNARNQEELSGLLPDAAHGHIIITSRNAAWSSEFARLAVAAWTPEDSVQYLQARTGLDDLQSLSAIAKALAHQPLALAQAAAQLESGDVA